MSEKNKAVIRRLFDDHWNAKDEALLSELFAPTISLSTPDNVYTGLRGPRLSCSPTQYRFRTSTSPSRICSRTRTRWS